jgi:hypothetical protein
MHVRGVELEHFVATDSNVSTTTTTTTKILISATQGFETLILEFEFIS